MHSRVAIAEEIPLLEVGYTIDRAAPVSDVWVGEKIVDRR